MALKLSLPRVQGEKGGGDEGVECMKMDSVPREECGGGGESTGGVTYALNGFAAVVFLIKTHYLHLRHSL